jgi:hypothetical protein
LAPFFLIINKIKRLAFLFLSNPYLLTLDISLRLAHNAAHGGVMAETCALSDNKLRGLKPGDKPYQIYDGDGLYVEIGAKKLSCRLFLP